MCGLSGGRKTREIEDERIAELNRGIAGNKYGTERTRTSSVLRGQGQDKYGTDRTRTRTVLTGKESQREGRHSSAVSLTFIAFSTVC